MCVSVFVCVFLLVHHVTSPPRVFFLWLLDSQSVMVEVPLKINRLKSGVVTQDKPKCDAGFNIWNWVCQIPSCSSLINPATLTVN